MGGIERYTNNHLLYLTTGRANDDQIADIIKKSIAAANKKLTKPIHTHFRVNVVKRENGEKLGFAYLWVTNEEAYHMLLGRNPDGTERTEVIDDPDWKPGTPREVARLEEEINNTTDWGKISDLEDELDKLRICPKIRVTHRSLIEIEPCPYTIEQRICMLNERVAAAARKEGRGRRKVDHKRVEEKGTEVTIDDIPEEFSIKVEQAYVNSIQSYYAPNILKITTMPNWISSSIIYNILKPYSTNPEYPKVQINRSKSALITFDPTSKDSLFALAMCMRTYIEHPITKHRTTLRFSYAKI